MADALNLVVKDLTQRELKVFERSFNRQLVLAFPEREIVDVFKRHEDEILMAAMISKEQMDAEVDGEIPSSGRVGGPLQIRAAYLGIGDDWEDVGAITTGSPQNWIHSGTTLMGGTPGNAIKIGENAVHIVLGIGTFHPSPKVESVQFTIDGKQRPIYATGNVNKVADMKIKEFDTSLVLKKDTTVLGKVMASTAFGSTVNDYPYILGVSFIKERQLRLHDPADIPGTVQDVVLTT